MGGWWHNNVIIVNMQNSIYPHIRAIHIHIMEYIYMIWELARRFSQENGSSSFCGNKMKKKVLNVWYKVLCEYRYMCVCVHRTDWINTSSLWQTINKYIITTTTTTTKTTTMEATILYVKFQRFENIANVYLCAYSYTKKWYARFYVNKEKK